jgi:CRP-like cAMP-binding protein
MVPHTDAFRPADVLAGRRNMSRGSFLYHLPPVAWPLFVQAWGADARVHGRDEVLPVRPDDKHVHIILGGCVSQVRFLTDQGDGGPKVTRFRATGHFLSEGKLIDLPARVVTTCLTDTWVMPCSVDRMNFLLHKHPDIQLALLRSLESRNRDDELVYGTVTRSPVQRVAGLLVHLAGTAGEMDAKPTGHVTIPGPSQKDLAEALLMGVSTVENALRYLRQPPAASGLPEQGVVLSKYRRFVVTDLPALRAFAAIS